MDPTKHWPKFDTFQELLTSNSPADQLTFFYYKMSQQQRYLESPTLSQLYLRARCVLYYFTTTHVYTRHVTIYVFIL